MVVFVKPATAVVIALVTAIAVRNTGERFGWLMVPVFVAATLMALTIPIYASMTGVSPLFTSADKSERFGLTIGMHVNELSLLLNTAFALSLFTLIGTRRGVVKILLAGVIGIVSVAVALTFSRGGYLGWLIVVAYLLVTRRKIVWLLGTVVVMAVAVAIMPPEIVERAFVGIQEGNMARVSAGRVSNIWLPLLPTLLESPLFGNGLGSVMWSEPMRRGTMNSVGHTHNAYLGLVLDLGIVGAVLVWMFWFRLWQGFRALARELSDPACRGYFEGASVCILVLLGQGLTDDRFTPTGSQSFIWVSAGIAFGLLGRASTHMAGKPSRSVPLTR
jgi:O-antigen ligase